jgi:mannosyltransferase
VAARSQPVSDAAPPAAGSDSSWLDRHSWLAVVGPMLAMLAMGLWVLDRGSLWQDEAASLDVAQRTVPEILAMVRQIDAVHTAFYMVMHVWMLPGGGEVWLRTLPMLATVCAAGLVGAIGTRLLNARTGLIAGLLFVATPFVSYYAQEGRSYALTCACVLLASYCLVRAVGASRRGWWVGYASAAAVAIMLHEFAVLAVAAHGVTLLWARVLRTVWLPFGISVGLCAVVAAPIAWVSSNQSFHVSFLSPPTWSTVAELVELQLGAHLVVLGAVLLLALVGALIPRKGPGPVQLRQLAVPLLLLPPTALLLASLWHPLYHSRYVFYTVACLPLLVACGIDRVGLIGGRPRPALTWALGAVMVGVVLFGQLPEHREIRTVAAHGNDLAGVARVIQQNARPGDAVVFMPTRYRSVAIAYPETFADLHDVAIAKDRLQAANLRGTDKTRRAVREDMLGQDRIWAIGRSGLRVRSNEPGAVNQRAVLDRYFTKGSCTSVPGQQVCLYVRRTG